MRDVLSRTEVLERRIEELEQKVKQAKREAFLEEKRFLEGIRHTLSIDKGAKYSLGERERIDERLRKLAEEVKG